MIPPRSSGPAWPAGAIAADPEPSLEGVGREAGVTVSDRAEGQPQTPADPVLCGHCGRTAGNGITCIGLCVADSGY